MMRVVWLLAAATLALAGTANAQRGGMGGGMGGERGGGFGGMQRFPVPDLPGPELDGPLDSARAADMMSLSPAQAASYAAAYDSFMTATQPTRDSVQAQLATMRQKLGTGDRAAATFYAERATRISKSLKDRQDKWEDQVFKLLSGDQVKIYKKWKKDTDAQAEERRKEESFDWQPGGGGFGGGERPARGGFGDAPPEQKAVINPGSSVGGMEGVSQAVRVGRMIYVSGQVALDSLGQVVGAGDLKAQAAKAFDNLTRVLRSGRADPSEVLRLTVYVVDYKPQDIALIRAAATEYFSGRLAPAMTVVGVQSLFRDGLLVAVDAIAQTSAPAR